VHQKLPDHTASLNLTFRHCTQRMIGTANVAANLKMRLVLSVALVMLAPSHESPHARQ
jgi:hypothetical protein